MNDQQIIALFQEAVAEVDSNVKLGEMTAKTELASLGLDSVMTMEVIGVMEEKLNVRFPDEDLATLKNMGDLTTLVGRLS
ncbi:MAG: acyl carrier protein [Deltaproteobacteria bacterium]